MERIWRGSSYLKHNTDGRVGLWRGSDDMPMVGDYVLAFLMLCGIFLCFVSILDSLSVYHQIAAVHMWVLLF